MQRNGLSWETGLALGVDVVCLLLPVVAGGGLAVRAATHADDVADVARVANRADDAVDAVRAVDRVDDAADVTRATKLRRLTKANFRENLMRLTGQSKEAVKGLEAHHILPVQYEKRFAEYGFQGASNIQNPVYGAWVDASEHACWSNAYNTRWKVWIKDHPNAAMDEVLEFARQLGKEYGFDVVF